MGSSDGPSDLSLVTSDKFKVTHIFKSYISERSSAAVDKLYMGSLGELLHWV